MVWPCPLPVVWSGYRRQPPDA